MAETPTPWFIERYTMARRIYPIRDKQAHDGFTNKRDGIKVPAQTWAQWFEWAYGMTLDEYAAIAKAGKHAAQIPADAVALCEYRVKGSGDQWSMVRGAPGETYEDLAAWMERTYPDVETRRRNGSETR